MRVSRRSVLQRYSFGSLLQGLLKDVEVTLSHDGFVTVEYDLAGKRDTATDKMGTDILEEDRVKAIVETFLKGVHGLGGDDDDDDDRLGEEDGDDDREGAKATHDDDDDQDDQDDDDPQEEEKEAQSSSSFREANYWLQSDEQPSNLSAQMLETALRANVERGVQAPVKVRVQIPAKVEELLGSLWDMKEDKAHEMRTGTRGYDLVLGDAGNPIAGDFSVILEPRHMALAPWVAEMRRSIEEQQRNLLSGSTFYDAHVLFQDPKMLASFDVHNDNHGARHKVDLTWSCTVLLAVPDRGAVPDGHPVGRLVVLGTDPVDYVHPGDGFLFQGHTFAHRTIPKTTGVALYKITFFWSRARSSSLSRTPPSSSSSSSSKQKKNRRAPPKKKRQRTTTRHE